MDPDFGISCWDWIYFLFYANFCRMFKEAVWRAGCSRFNTPDSSCPHEQGQLFCQKDFPLSQQWLAPAGFSVWSQETLIPSPILQPFCRSLTSNTHCMTPSRDSEVLPVLVLPCHITHHKMGRSHFLGSALFPEDEHSFCWEHQCHSVHIPWLDVRKIAKCFFPSDFWQSDWGYTT